MFENEAPIDTSEYEIVDSRKVKKEKPEETERIEKIRHAGVLAQNVQEVFPEAVREMYDGTLAVSYDNLVALLIEAIKEQNAEIEKLKSNSELKSAESNSELSVLSEESGAALYQNTPNPFTENTVIEFYLPQDVSKANLYIYDLQGRQIKNIDIVQRESGSVTIYGEELQPGMYKYALIADSKIIGTKTMILTD